MTILVLLAILILLLLGLLFLPIIIFIDTTSNQYYLQLKGVFKINFEKHDMEIFRLRLKILFFNFYFYPLKINHFKKPKNTVKNTLKKPKQRMHFRKVIRIIKTFKVKKIYINIDTGNCILNAKLYPLFALLNYNSGNYFINFQGQNQFILVMENKPIDILLSYY